MSSDSPSPPPESAEAVVPSQFVLMGRIAGAHGLRGELLVRTFTETPDGIAAYGALCDREGTRHFRLTVVRETAKGVIARVAGVSDRTAAEALRGTELYVPRARLPAPDAGSYYYEDLAGLAAVAPDGQRLGRIVGVANYGAGDLLEVRLEGRKATELVPFADPFVPEVDVVGGRVVIDMSLVAPASEDGAPDMEAGMEDEDEGIAGEGDDAPNAGDDNAADSAKGEPGEPGSTRPRRGKRRGKAHKPSR